MSDAHLQTDQTYQGPNLTMINVLCEGIQSQLMNIHELSYLADLCHKDDGGKGGENGSLNKLYGKHIKSIGR